MILTRVTHLENVLNNLACWSQTADLLWWQQQAGIALGKVRYKGFTGDISGPVGEICIHIEDIDDCVIAIVEDPEKIEPAFKDLVNDYLAAREKIA